MSVVIDNAKLDRVARSVHAAIALDEGMKAGFKAYMAAPGHDRALDSLPKKVAFDRYCGEFGPYIEVLNDVQEPVSELDALRAEIEELKAQLKTPAKAPASQGKLQDAIAKVRKPKAQKAASKHVGRESRFSNGVIERKNLPTDIGATFVWKGANGKSTWEVVDDDGDAIYAVRVA